MLTAARVFGVIGCILSIALGLPWWAHTFFGGATIWAFSTAPVPRRAYICGRQILVMTEREALQRNAALAANGLEERWQ